jgi:hypothetical protein
VSGGEGQTSTKLLSEVDWTTIGVELKKMAHLAFEPHPSCDCFVTP